MKIAYIAFDNKVFDTEKACKEYEDKYSDVLFFDSEGVSIKFKRENYPNYILLPTIESVNYFRAKIEEWVEETDKEDYYHNDFSVPGIYIYAASGHYYYYDSAEMDIAKTLLKEAGF